MANSLSSAFSEFVRAAFYANASKLIILTDAPRFSQIIIRDDGRGWTTEFATKLTKELKGGDKMERGRGLSTAARLARRFLIITKVENEGHRTVAEIALQTRSSRTECIRIWQVQAVDVDSHGTEIKLLDLYEHSHARLASLDLWATAAESKSVKPPTWHTGRMKANQDTFLDVLPQLPWFEDDSPKEKMRKLARAVRDVGCQAESGNFNGVFDRYLQVLWMLATSPSLHLKSRNDVSRKLFEVFFDGVQIVPFNIEQLATVEELVV